MEVAYGSIITSCLNVCYFMIWGFYFYVMSSVIKVWFKSLPMFTFYSLKIDIKLFSCKDVFFEKSLFSYS
jgi:hypothetical protein